MLEKKFLNFAKKIFLFGIINYFNLSCQTQIFHEENNSKENEKETFQINSPWYSNERIFERVYFFDDFFDKKEKDYGIPKGLLKGLAMQESLGNPLSVSYDGGVGEFMLQPGTARKYGLKVYGNSNKTGADTTHAKEMKKLLKKYNYDYSKLIKIDERFDIKKSSDVAARCLIDLHKGKGHNSWNKALSAYNQGTPAFYASRTKHVKKIREYQEYYNERDGD
ncbi:MAG: transglycosylase SLT domain-containing protein [Candidatus Pacearchaeota archaeon]|jgi:hypothetical protein